MGEHTELTGTAVVGLAALACGMAMTRLRLPPVAGYILAGIILGPTALGFIENAAQVRLLADLGVLMLLFMVGLELDVADFMKVWRLALLTVAAQIGGMILITLGLSEFFGWPLGFAVILAFVLALSSTAVAIKMLEEIGETETATGRVTLAVLIAQDLAVVPMILTVDDLAGRGVSAEGIAKVVIAVAAVTAIIFYLARRGRFSLPFTERVASHSELRPIAVVALCLAASAFAGLVGLSAAYGAFLAGLVIGNTNGLRPLIDAAKPIEGLLMMVFFLSIGLLIDLTYIWENIGTVLLWLLMVTLIKTALNISILRLQGQPWQQAFLAGVLLGQVGEFSFLITAAGVAAGLVAPEQSRLVIAIVALSLLVSPLWLVTARRLHSAAAKRRRNLKSLLNYLYGGEAQWIAAGLGACSRHLGNVVSHTRKGMLTAAGQFGSIPARVGNAIAKIRKKK